MFCARTFDIYLTVMEYIKSTSNPKIKAASRLVRDAAARRESGCFFLEGARLCRDAVQSGIEVDSLFYTCEAAERFGEYIAEIIPAAREVFEVSPEAAVKLADTKSTQGVFCVCKMLDKSDNIGKIENNKRYVALENVSDPVNLAAVSRSAEAFGLDGLIVSGGCDIYNPKALRASMGALFRIPLFVADDLPSVINSLCSHGMSVYAAVPDRSALSVTEADFSHGAVCAVGNEGNGLSDDIVSICTPLTLPMRGRAESLNAAAAAAVLIWEMMK